MAVSRRQFVTHSTLGAVGLLAGVRGALAQEKADADMVVYMSPTCGCCSPWVDHMKANGFSVSVKRLDDMTPIKTQHRVPTALQSCHTGLVAGYVVEGHVPAADVKRLLREKPKVVGLTIPGMPASAPGMDLTPFQPYEVLAFDSRGKTTVYAKHDK